MEHGMAREDSCVMVHGGEAPHNLQDHASATAKELLMTFAGTMAVLGANNAGMGGEMLLVLGPEHARIIARDGLKKDDIREELHRLMRIRFDSLGVSLRNFYRNRRPLFDVGPEVQDIPYFDDPSRIIVLVAGGPGLHSMAIPSFGGSTRIVLEPVHA